MRGADVMQESLFTMKRLEDFVPKAHPLRDIRALLNAALQQMDADFRDSPNGTSRAYPPQARPYRTD